MTHSIFIYQPCLQEQVHRGWNCEGRKRSRFAEL